MAKLTKREKLSITAKFAENEQEKKRVIRAALVASGTYRPRAVVFTDRRRDMLEKAIRRELNW